MGRIKSTCRNPLPSPSSCRTAYPRFIRGPKGEDGEDGVDGIGAERVFVTDGNGNKWEKIDDNGTDRFLPLYDNIPT